MEVFVAEVAPPSSNEDTLLIRDAVRRWGYLVVREVISFKTRLCFSDSIRPITEMIKSSVSWAFSCSKYNFRAEIHKNYNATVLTSSGVFHYKSANKKLRFYSLNFSEPHR